MVSEMPQKYLKNATYDMSACLIGVLCSHVMMVCPKCIVLYAKYCIFVFKSSVRPGNQF